MRRKILTLLCLVALVAVVVLPTSAQDPISGKWSGDWGPSRFDRNRVTVEFKLSGKAVTGTVDSEGKVVPVKNGTFDPNTNTFHMEADAPGPGNRIVHFVIDGKLENNTLSGSWNHDTRKGDFKITRQ
jgi:hypothetical protein